MSPNELLGSVAAMAAGTRKEVKRKRQQSQLHREIERWSAPGLAVLRHPAVAGPLTTIVFVADATDTLAGLNNISAPATIETGRQHQPHQQLNTAGSHKRQSPLHLILCIWHNTLSIASACDWLPLSFLPVVICVADDQWCVQMASTLVQLKESSLHLHALNFLMAQVRSHLFKSAGCHCRFCL